MRRYTYSSRQEYVSIQEEWNKKKIGIVWVTPEAISAVAAFIRSSIPDVQFGICHGTRRGVEQEMLSKELGIRVIGTEISDTALQFPNTIQWDFHQVKQEWIGVVDFIYSNSFDHAVDPELAISQWMKCLKPMGLCFVDWSGSDHGDNHVNALDCFGASLAEMRDFLSRFGDVSEIAVSDRHPDHVIFVLKNRETTR